MHDSRAAVPLSLISAAGVTNRYNMVDAAYCCIELHECSNAGLKHKFGGRNLRVKGTPEVMDHLMPVVLALSADQLIRLRR